MADPIVRCPVCNALVGALYRNPMRDEALVCLVCNDLRIEVRQNLRDRYRQAEDDQDDDELYRLGEIIQEFWGVPEGGEF